MIGTDYASLRQRLTESLAEQGAFREEWTRPVFESVPRHLFVPDRVWTWQDDRWRSVNRLDDPQQWGELVYHPTDALVTQVDDGQAAEDGSGLSPTSSISCARAVLNMLSSLDPQPGHAVLEIGTGTGYNAALLCERVGDQSVVTVEVDAALTVHARERLHRAGYHPEVACADGELGFPGRAPFDRIISTASVRRVPFAWLEQMKPGGEIVTPWLPGHNGLGLIWLRMWEQGVARGWFHGAEAFMPVRGQRFDRPELTELWSTTSDLAQQTEEVHDLSDLDGIHGRFVLGVMLPGTTCYQQGDGGWFFLTEDRSSWARFDGKNIRRYGDRDLIGDVLFALQWWREHDRPRLYDFGVTVTADEQTVWFGGPDQAVPRR